MKPIISIICLLCMHIHCYAVTPALDIAVETNGIKVEFNTAINRGSIHVYDCKQCTESNYYFTKKPQILKSGRLISFEKFMKDFWNAKYPTLILDKKTFSVLKVIY